MTDKSEPTSHFVTLDGVKVHYLSAGEGEAVLMLHGCPTSYHLWRDVLPSVGQHKHAIALDLPGFGLSDKPPGTRYSFSYYEKIIEDFLHALDIAKIDIVVHDLGGPVGLLWALRHPEKVRRLALLNTLVYPEMSMMVKIFMISLRLPGLRHWISSPSGIRFSMKFGVTNKDQITDAVMKPYLEPFTSKEARIGLLKGGQGLSIRGFREIAEKLPSFEAPVMCLYGENDRILPDVAKTMARVKVDLPQTEISSLPNCGHFLQEDDAESVGEKLAAFLTR